MCQSALGALTRPVAVFGEAVSNSDAQRTFLSETEGAVRICAGGIVSYCADPSGSVALVRASGARVVRGNREISLATGSEVSSG